MIPVPVAEKGVQTGVSNLLSLSVSPRGLAASVRGAGQLGGASPGRIGTTQDASPHKGQWPIPKRGLIRPITRGICFHSAFIPTFLGIKKNDFFSNTFLLCFSVVFLQKMRLDFF